MKAILDVKEIQRYLPHRYPFLLVDRILEIEPGKRIVGLKNVTFNEHFFQGHFPQSPVMPGVLVIEAMAQVGGVLAYYSAKEEARGKLIYFAALDKVKFRRPVIPGDQLILELEMLRYGSRACKMRGKALVDGEVVAEGELTAVLAE
ncbi:MAG TPA: 3-hydroxyacyl-ACP dehydratase FabZ [Candidatus Desulfofervidus auxilii]|uniref:3-hydroxyacyl-[acyl-carrier-protein] dehydratase FabZ n=1 Tax=Desulfofervidus auxilii TaxID=1621989 RepID=A0A7V0NEN7_DESA2|nr:3-hydroxyacyl-ACP dehydratase FabZ [Candidatus Desulfofervidus auxilii]